MLYMTYRKSIYINFTYPVILIGGGVSMKDNEFINLELEEDDFEKDDIYSEDARSHLLEDDGLSSAEEAFMRGWDTAGGG